MTSKRISISTTQYPMMDLAMLIKIWSPETQVSALLSNKPSLSVANEKLGAYQGVASTGHILTFPESTPMMIVGQAEVDRLLRWASKPLDTDLAVRGVALKEDEYNPFGNLDETDFLKAEEGSDWVPIALQAFLIRERCFQIIEGVDRRDCSPKAILDSITMISDISIDGVCTEKIDQESEQDFLKAKGWEKWLQT